MVGRSDLAMAFVFCCRKSLIDEDCNYVCVIYVYGVPYLVYGLQSSHNLFHIASRPVI